MIALFHEFMGILERGSAPSCLQKREGRDRPGSPAASDPTERHAWTLLRKRQILGYKFRRQHILHGFIVDFYCHELRLVLELEGTVHGAPGMTDYDAARTEWLRLAGYRVMRIGNRDVSRDGLGKVIGQVAHQPHGDRKSPSP